MAANILTLAQYKTIRGIELPEKDNQISAAIPAVEQIILDYIDRDLTADQSIATKNYPYERGSTIVNIDDCQTVTSVKLNGRTLYPGHEYVTGTAPAEPVISWLEVQPNIGAVDPLFAFTHVVSNDRRRPFQTIEVTALFGWPAGKIPASATQAAVWLMDEIISNSTQETGKAAESIADLSYVFRGEENPLAGPVLPPRVQQILNPLRRVSV